LQRTPAPPASPLRLDPNALFSRAEKSFLARDYAAARTDLTAVLAATGEQAPVLHLLALVEKGAGSPEAARSAFERALRLQPSDPQILANYANLLRTRGDLIAALAACDRALTASPGYRPARITRASLLRELGRPSAALSELDDLLNETPGDPALLVARGAALLDLRKPRQAADGFDAALAKAPGRPAALHGRARAALLLGEEDAAVRYRKLRELAPDDLSALLGEAQALAEIGDPRACDTLVKAVEARPEWVEGHTQLALIRYEAGDRRSFAEHFSRAVTLRPRDAALHLAWWRSLNEGGSHNEALEVARRLVGLSDGGQDLRVPLAVSLVDNGLAQDAIALLGNAPTEPAAQLALGRAALAAARPDMAAKALQAAVTQAPDLIGAWALLDIAWRLLEDPRHLWLSRQPGLFGTCMIDFSAAELSELAVALRALHRTRSHPIGQSLRGGTQTRGRLFDRGDPILGRLATALEQAVDAHRSAMPRHDAGHPLLRHRHSAFDIGGAWSVRLSGSGFHVSHMHPEGVLSSAFYVALPSSLGGTEQAGWLELGRPPAELGLDLEPMITIEPLPGLLALFPSYLYHGTRPFPDGERLTVAFDIVAP
jgi:tetratricopeptide (TPR) repeat protein